MASFPDVRPSSERSADAERFRVFRRPLAVAALLPAAAGIALALSELATLRGNRAVHSLDQVPA
jgi:hypothetical protein